MNPIALDENGLKDTLEAGMQKVLEEYERIQRELYALRPLQEHDEHGGDSSGPIDPRGLQ